MGRKDEVTILKTSISELFARLIDAYITQEKKKHPLTARDMSRANVMETAVLDYLLKKADLPQSATCPNASLAK